MLRERLGGTFNTIGVQGPGEEMVKQLVLLGNRGVDASLPNGILGSAGNHGRDFAVEAT